MKNKLINVGLVGATLFAVATFFGVGAFAVPAANASPGYLMGSVTAQVTGALQLSISGSASANLYVGTDVQQFVTIDWGEIVAGNPARDTFSVKTAANFTTHFSDTSKVFDTSWTPVTHTYGSAGTKTILVKVHHGTFPGKESNTSEFTTNVFIPQAALNVIKHVVGGSSSASNFTLHVSGTNVSPTSFSGSESGTVVSLDPGSYSVTEDAVSVYGETLSADCSGSVASGQTKTCTLTNTYNPGKTTPTITWNNPADIVYGTALSVTQLNATANVSGTFAYTPVSGTVLGVGNGQTLHVDLTPTDTTNYNTANKDVTINVGVEAVAVTPDPGQSKVYGETDLTFTYTTTPSVALSGALGRDLGENVGTYAYTLGSLSGSGYSPTLSPETFAITARAIIVTAVTNSKAYDGTDSAAATPAITSGILQGSDTADFAEAYDTRNVGTGKTLASFGSVNDGNSGNNYSYTFINNDSGVITPATLTYNANPVTRNFGSTNPIFFGTVTGFVGGDTQAGSTLGGPPTWTSPATETSPPGSYAIDGGGLTANNGNYVFAQAAGNATALTVSETPVTTATLTLTVPETPAGADASVTVNGTTTSYTGPVTLNDGDTFSVTGTPVDGYAVGTSGDGCNGTAAAGNSYSCTVTYTPNPSPTTATLTLTVPETPAGAGASVTVNGTTTSYTGPIILNEGDTFSVAGTPVDGYTVGTSGTGCSGTAVGDTSYSCTVTYTLIPPPEPTATSTLNVVVAVSGGTAAPADFTVTIIASNPSVSTFPGDAAGTAVTIDASAAYNVNLSSLANYTMGTSGNCNETSGIPEGGSATCTITETYTAPAPSGGGGGTSSGVNSGDGVSGGSYFVPSAGGGQVLGASTGPVGEVLGASTNCGQYLSAYIKYGKNNDTEQVKLLQQFLNQELGMSLQITGYYGLQSKAAVEKFQLKYSTDVLAPWVSYGLPNAQTPTGYVYKTTRRWINMLNCAALNIPLPQLP